MVKDHLLLKQRHVAVNHNPGGLFLLTRAGEFADMRNDLVHGYSFDGLPHSSSRRQCAI